MIVARSANVIIHNTSDFRVAFLALSAAYQVRGLTPWKRKVAIPARFTQIILVIKSNKAPAASSYSPAPSNNPKTVSGGNKATATITPMTAAEAPVVNASTPAAPDARAKIISPKPKLVLEDISTMPVSILIDNPILAERILRIPLIGSPPSHVPDKYRFLPG